MHVTQYTLCLECQALKEQLSRQSSQHITRLSELERHITELDRLKSNLKMQIVELELEKASFQHEQDMKVGELEEKLSRQVELASASDTKWKDQIKRLEAEIEEVRIILTTVNAIGLFLLNFRKKRSLLMRKTSPQLGRERLSILSPS